MTIHTYEPSGANIVFEVFDGEVVIVNLDSGKYYSIKNIGAYVWNALIVHNCPQQIVAAIQENYHNVTPSIQTDIDQFLKQLIEEGLVKESCLPLAKDIAKPANASYQPPTIDVYSDMQEILLLDPVHDVDESGWPVAQK